MALVSPFSIITSLALNFASYPIGFFSTNKMEVMDPSVYQTVDYEKATHEVSINFARFPNTRWKESEIAWYTKGLAEVYAQCGIRLSSVQIYKVEAPIFRPEVEKFNHDSEFSFAALSDQTSNIPRPAVYLIDALTDSGASVGQEPFAKAWFKEFVDYVTRTHLSLVDTVWFPYYVNSEEYLSVRNYNALAHELTHVFAQDGLHNSGPEPNLMITYLSKKRNNYILPRVCQEMLENPLIKKIQ